MRLWLQINENLKNLWLAVSPSPSTADRKSNYISFNFLQSIFTSHQIILFELKKRNTKQYLSHTCKGQHHLWKNVCSICIKIAMRKRKQINKKNVNFCEYWAPAHDACRFPKNGFAFQVKSLLPNGSIDRFFFSSFFSWFERKFAAIEVTSSSRWMYIFSLYKTQN